MMVVVKNEQTAKACLFIFEGWRALIVNFKLPVVHCGNLTKTGLDNSINRVPKMGAIIGTLC
jgi:hypothetical protein